MDKILPNYMKLAVNLSDYVIMKYARFEGALANNQLDMQKTLVYWFEV
jgi:hypothetical protein